MEALWAWLAVAAAGALHGLNPLCGWLPAALCGARSRDRREVWRALRPIAFGHAMAIAIVAATVAISPAMDRRPMLLAAGALLCVVLLLRAPARTGATLGAFVAAAVHGTGLMLVPALVPLCIGDSAAARITASGSLVLAIAALAVHMAAMLAVTVVVALGVGEGARQVRPFSNLVSDRTELVRRTEG